MTSIQTEIQELHRDLQELEKRAREIKNLIIEKETIVQSNCDHEWERERWCYDHRTHWFCKKCDLYR